MRPLAHALTRRPRLRRWAGCGLALAVALGMWCFAAAPAVDTARALPAVTATPTDGQTGTTGRPTSLTSSATTSMSPRPTPTTTGTATVTATASTVTMTTTVTAPPVTTPAQPASSPAVQRSPISLTSALFAVLALGASALTLWLVHRRDRRPGPTQLPALPVPAAPPGTAPTPAAAVTEGLTALLVELGQAMVDAGYPVTEVDTVLQRVATASGIPNSEIIVLPTALLVSLPGQATVETAATTAGRAPLRLDQIDALAALAQAAGSGTLAPQQAREQLRRIRSQPAPFGPLPRAIGYVLFSAGLSLIMRGSLVDLLVAAGLGAVVGIVLLASAGMPSAWRAVLPLTCAFGVAVAVFLLGRTGLDIGVVPPLVAPLVTFLPGGLLTIAVLELATGQMISGAGRLAEGTLQLVLLALGIVAGAQLVGVPATAVSSAGAQPLGDLAPWVGVAVFGVGVVMNRCARPSSTGWILLVLYVAYGAQVIGGLFLGAVLSAFVGALCMSPVAVYVSRRPTEPATQVSFLPGFWLLVPGALGLVGVTMLLGEDRSNAFATLTTTLVTMVAISFGVLIGQGTSVQRRRDSAEDR